MPPSNRRARGARSNLNSTRSTSSRISRLPISASSSSLAHIEISGFRDSKAASHDDGGIQSVISWLERKARTNQEKNSHRGIQKRAVPRIRKSRLDKDGNSLHIYVPADDALYYTNLDGFIFAGSTIQVNLISRAIRERDRVQSPLHDSRKPAFSFKSRDSEALVSTLKNLLSRRYDVTSKILNLTSMLEEPEVKQVLSRPGSTMSKLFAALSSLCEAAFPSKEARAENITGLQLAQNKFQSLLPVRALAWQLPDLVNLDVSHNNIQGADGLNHFRQCTKLQNILIAGNPWTQRPDFKSQLLRAFPSLKTVDGAQVTDADLAQVKSYTEPTIAPGIYLDSTGLAQKFIQTFFAGFDTDRNTLAKYYYDGNSTFSYTVNTRAIMDPKSVSNLTKGEWEAWIYNSRNLVKITQPAPRKNRAYRGSTAIFNVFEQMPRTQHASFEDMDKWLVECIPLQGIRDPTNASPTGINGLMIVVHGEFIENGDNVVKRKHRSFDRTFVLGSGGNNPDGVGIVSDMLNVRGYGGTKAFYPTPNPSQSPEDQKAGMIAQVQKQTNMKPEYALMCLEQTSWNIEAALESFQQVRANIPLDAFMS